LGDTLALTENDMSEKSLEISKLLHEAAETHHRVYQIVNGTDPDWATWYADWLVNLSQLADLLGVKPVRSELTYMLVSLDKEFTREAPPQAWEDFYAEKLVAYFSSAA
jgi:hypothetical protein